MDELKLWDKIKNGDVSALNRLHSIYFHQMCLFAKKSIYDNQLIENIVSDCFILLWEKRRNIKINTSVKSYLYRILRNKIIDHFREKQELTDLVNELPNIPDEKVFDEQEHYAALYMVISKLPDQRKKILEMAVFDSMTYQQIADKLQISKNTVKTQIARAYRFLKESLEPKDFFLFYVLSKEG